MPALDFSDYFFARRGAQEKIETFKFRLFINGLMLVRRGDILDMIINQPVLEGLLVMVGCEFLHHKLSQKLLHRNGLLLAGRHIFDNDIACLELIADDDTEFGVLLRGVFQLL